jgi:hypothetical protein
VTPPVAISRRKISGVCELKPSPAEQVLVRIDQPRGDKTTAGVDDFEIDADGLQGAAVNVPDLLDLVARKQD